MEYSIQSFTHHSLTTSSTELKFLRRFLVIQKRRAMWLIENPEYMFTHYYMDGEVYSMIISPTTQYTIVCHPLREDPSILSTGNIIRCITWAYITMRTLPCIHYHAYITMHTLPGIHYHAYITRHTLPCIHYHVYITMHTLPCIHYHVYITMHKLPCIHYDSKDAEWSTEAKVF